MDQLRYEQVATVAESLHGKKDMIELFLRISCFA